MFLYYCAYLGVIFGLEGTPPGVLIFTGWLRVPSPLRVKAATCMVYRVSGANPVTLYDVTSPLPVLKVNGT